MKKLLTLVLAACLLLSAFPFTAAAADGDRSGVTGTCTWNYDAQEKKLTIGGAGETDYYSFDEPAPWHELDVRKLTVEDGVVRIRSGAFIGLKIESVVIPPSVLTIGMIAFADCQSLKAVTFSEGLEEINGGAFSNCAALERIDLPESMKRIGPFAFENCSALETVSVPDTLESIGVAIFDNTKWFENLPEGAVYLGSILYTFKGNMPEGYTLTIRKGTRGVAAGALGGAPTQKEHLTRLVIPDSVTTIGENAFYACVNLSAVRVPAGVTALDERCFGFNYDPETDGNVALDGFVICGAENSAAQTYAADFGFTFVRAGDADGNGVVNVADVTAIQRQAAEIEDVRYPIAADNDQNGKVEIGDATLALQYLAEFTDTL